MRIAAGILMIMLPLALIVISFFGDLMRLARYGPRRASLLKKRAERIKRKTGRLKRRRPWIRFA